MGLTSARETKKDENQALRGLSIQATTPSTKQQTTTSAQQSSYNSDDTGSSGNGQFPQATLYKWSPDKPGDDQQDINPTNPTNPTNPPDSKRKEVHQGTLDTQWTVPNLSQHQ
mgnify:CR=1 FL=1